MKKAVEMSSREVIVYWNAYVDQNNLNHLYIFENTNDIVSSIIGDKSADEARLMLDNGEYDATDKYVYINDGRLISFTLAYEQKSPVNYDELEKFLATM